MDTNERNTCPKKAAKQDEMGETERRSDPPSEDEREREYGVVKKNNTTGYSP